MDFPSGLFLQRIMDIRRYAVAQGNLHALLLRKADVSEKNLQARGTLPLIRMNQFHGHLPVHPTVADIDGGQVGGAGVSPFDVFDVIPHTLQAALDFLIFIPRRDVFHFISLPVQFLMNDFVLPRKYMSRDKQTEN